jgi:hypothetical protein
MSRWTDWVKNWASENKMSYGCALSKPQCSAEYREEYGLPLLEKHTAFLKMREEKDAKNVKHRERRAKLKEGGVYSSKQLK